MEIRYKPQAIKHLQRIHPKDKEKAKKKIEFLIEFPLLGKFLQGELRGLRSVRAWPLRIIYTYNSKKQIVIIEDVDYRGGVYK